MNFHPDGQTNRKYAARVALALATVARVLDDLHSDGGYDMAEFDKLHSATGWLDIARQGLEAAVDDLSDVETVRNLRGWKDEKERIAEHRAARLMRQRERQAERRIQARERETWAESRRRAEQLEVAEATNQAETLAATTARRVTQS